MRLSGQRLIGMRPNGMRSTGMRPNGMRLKGYGSRERGLKECGPTEWHRSDEVHNFEAWCDSSKQQSPPFQFWYLVLSMELEILSLIRSFREANLDLYRPSLVLLRQQQCELRTMAPHPSERHVETGGETPPACPCIRERNICCTQIKPRLLSNSYRSSARASQYCH